MRKFAFILLIWSLSLNCANGCADFLIFMNGQTHRSAESTRELALSLSNQLEIDSRLHRVAISLGTDPENEVINFEKIKTKSDFIKTIQEWSPEQLTISSKGLEQRLDKTLKQAISQRRNNIAIVVILIDDDGSSSFTVNPANFGVFSEFVRKRHYVHTLIVSRKAERIRNALDFEESSVDVGSNRDELRLIASPFTKCQIRKANELRRKPLTRISSTTTIGPILTSETRNLQTDIFIDPSRFVTVPVSIRFPTIKISTTPRLTTSIPFVFTQKTTTSKPKKSGCQFDIVILYDLSTNSADNLPKYQNLTHDLINKTAEIGSNGSQFALVRYSGPGRTDTAFHLNKHTNRTLLLNDLQKVQPMGGTTRTAEAMLYALREFYPKFGGREKAEVERYMIVFTDGHSQDDVSNSAKTLSRDQIHIFSVAIDDPNFKPDAEQLKLIATDAKSAILDTNFNRIVDQLAPIKCRV